MTQLVRQRIHLRGIVQGVGFRPHVARQAAACNVTGFCGNSDEEVFIEAQGSAQQVECFRVAVVDCAPPLSVIDSATFETIDVCVGDDSFKIVASDCTGGERTLIPADGACCDECIQEMRDQKGRRFGYPFITCTNCGPRLSIILDLPYDRPQTTLANFPLCANCQREYSDPLDRRFHAQPIGCFDCGPRVWLTDSSGNQLAGVPPTPGKHGQDPKESHAVIQATQRLLKEGKIVAVKGLGGFALMVDATNEDAVARLRSRKNRPAKPLAVMCGDLAQAQSLGRFSQAGIDQLCSQRRPIVLAPRVEPSDLAPQVCAAADQVGVMLPSAAVHFLLCAGLPPLVATSANVSGEPLYSDNEEAIDSLGNVADAFLLNNRDIHHPIEDSVIAQMDSGELQIIRRARGYVPLGHQLPTEADHCVLGIGAEMKNALTLTRNGRAFSGPHLADMEMLRSRQLLGRLVSHWENLHQRSPRLVVADAHPQYHSRQWAYDYAAAKDVSYLEVQHHHAHALSLFAQMQVRSPRAVVAALDGTGWGTDGTIWGCEFLTFTGDELLPSRTATLPQFRLIGGDASARNPWRIARALLQDWNIDGEGLDYLEGVAPAEQELIDQLLAAGLGSTSTTSMGRLLDAVSSLCGLGSSVSFEAEGPIRLEALARRYHPESSQVPITECAPTTPRQAVEHLVHALKQKQDPSRAAWNFHRDISIWIADTLAEQAQNIDAQFVGLTGGCAVNRLIETHVLERLTKNSISCAVHRTIPAGDGGLGLGQAWAGHLWLEKGGEINVLCDSRSNLVAVGRS